MYKPGQRELLAEFLGGKVINVRRSLPYPQGIGYQDERGVRPLPDPLNSDADAHALIDALGKQGVGVDIYMRPWMKAESVTMYMQGEPIEWKERRWSGDNYRTGLVELATKIVEEKRDE